MIFDGRALAGEVLARTKGRAAIIGRILQVSAIVVGESAATKSYLSIKTARAADAGCVLEVIRFPEDTSTAALRASVLSASVDAIIVQLPLPASIDTKEVCDAILVEKDADVLSAAARAKFEQGDADALLPPVVGAVREILKSAQIEITGKKAVVIGNGWLVGNPCAKWLQQQGADVSIFTSTSGDLSAALRGADIVVSGAGSPNLITPNLLKNGVTLIDAGTSESGGAVVGDADPACAQICSLFTPVPGGVGPLAVACLFENVIRLAEEQQAKIAPQESH